MKHTDETISPGRIAWQRLKRNRPAVFGLSVIAMAIFTAIFCYLIVPDRTPNANSMCLPISMQKPGFQVDFLLIPKETHERSGYLNRTFLGAEREFNRVAIQSWKVQHDSLYYEEFLNDDQVRGASVSLPLHKLGLSSEEMTDPVVCKQIISARLIEHRHFILGTDRFGRDLLSRLLIGTRVSLSVGFIAVIISLVIGITVGALAGYFRGWIDAALLWFINVVWSIPTLLLVIAITMALGKGFAQVFIAVGLTMWVEVARLVRGQFFSLREQQFVEAGSALGYKHARIILRHILPNLMGPVIVVAASNFASAILLEAGLSFLGMGAQPPMPSWGMMIKENYAYIVVDAAYLAIWPGAMIALMVLSFTLLGNGLRDAFDTKLSVS